MKKFKVVDGREKYRKDPDCEVMHDNNKAFVVNKHTTDNQGNTTNRLLILNPRKFQGERIVDEQEAIVLILKGSEVKEIKE